MRYNSDVYYWIVFAFVFECLWFRGLFCDQSCTVNAHEEHAEKNLHHDTVYTYFQFGHRNNDNNRIEKVDSNRSNDTKQESHEDIHLVSLRCELKLTRGGKGDITLGCTLNK